MKKFAKSPEQTNNSALITSLGDRRIKKPEEEAGLPIETNSGQSSENIYSLTEEEEIDPTNVEASSELNAQSTVKSEPYDPKEIKTYPGAGGKKLRLPKGGKVLLYYNDNDNNGKINIGSHWTDLDAKVGDVRRFELNGIIYHAHFHLETQKFLGYFDVKTKKKYQNITDKAANYLMSSETMNALEKRTKDFGENQNKEPLPAGSTGWCLTWLHQQCVAMYGGKASEYGDRITAAMDKLVKDGKANELAKIYPLDGKGNKIKGSGSDEATSPHPASFEKSLDQVLLSSIEYSPGLYLFALTPGNGYHCTFLGLNNIGSPKFTILHDYGPRPVSPSELTKFFIEYTRGAIRVYSSQKHDYDIALRIWMLKMSL